MKKKNIALKKIILAASFIDIKKILEAVKSQQEFIGESIEVYEIRDKYIYFGDVSNVIPGILKGKKEISCYVITPLSEKYLKVLDLVEERISRLDKNLKSILKRVLQICNTSGNISADDISNRLRKIKGLPYVADNLLWLKENERADKIKSLHNLMVEGFSLNEISRRLDIKYCTVISWLKLNDDEYIKQVEPYKKALLKMKKNKISYIEMSEKLNIPRPLIVRWFKYNSKKTEKRLDYRNR